MHLYIELWKPRQKWLDLSRDERKDYVRQVGPSIGELADAGVELVGFAISDEETPYRADYRYLAAWKMPGQEQVDLLERILEKAGWHEHFEQVNARGEVVPPADVLEDMVGLV